MLNCYDKLFYCGNEVMSKKIIISNKTLECRNNYLINYYKPNYKAIDFNNSGIFPKLELRK